MTLLPCRSVPFFLAIAFVTALSSPAVAQKEFRYTPCKTYDEHSGDLIKALRLLMEEEYESALKATRHKEFIRKLYGQRTDHIVDLVKAGLFIRNDSLENYVKAVVDELAAGYPLASQRRVVLIARTQEVNAFCYSRGIYVVTIGLLARISTEGELAFTLAHEIAHSELDHIKTGILREAEMRLAKKSNEQVKRLLTGEVELADLEEFRELVYGVSRHSRKRELSADSLGYVIFNNTGYYADADALSMLEVLKSREEPKYRFGAELLAPIDAEDFPLQDYFFAEQLSLYKTRSAGNFVFSTDSLRSHPDMNQRKTLLKGYFTGAPATGDGQDEAFVRAVTTLAEFETVEAAFRERSYDWCLYHALHLLVLYPNNSYLVSRVGAVLVNLYEIKDERPMLVNSFVSRYTGNYSEVARLINNLLHNLTTREIGEMAFYFLNDPDHFNESVPNHYYLLWKVSEKTRHYDVRDEMRAAYKARFDSNISSFRWQ